jgi:hypothetical protein
MKYPLSIATKGTVSDFFYDIMMLHIPPTPSTIILDPTCGKRHLWVKFLRPKLIFINGKSWIIDDYRKVIFSDIKNFGYNNIIDLFTFPLSNEKVDGIVYDPPYYYNNKNTKTDDKRAEDYGDYTHSLRELHLYMKAIDKNLAPLLKPKGKLILKCADQYQPEERKFVPLHIQWANSTKLRLVDFYVYRHHNFNPTAFQVKKRPCSVIMHTYFMVFQKGTESIKNNQKLNNKNLLEIFCE